MDDRAVRGDENDLASVGDLTSGDVRRGPTERFGSEYSFLRSASVGSAVSAFLAVGLAAIGWAAGFSIFPTLAGAFLIGTVSGTVLTGTLLSAPHRAEQRELREYLERLSKFRIRGRASAFESLKLNSSNGVVGAVSYEVHRLVTEVYAGYAEGMHLRRTLDTRIATETRKAKARLDHVAYFDGLTKLLNRRALDETLPYVLNEIIEGRGDAVCLTIDVDYFKDVNDRIGHDRGDAALRFLGDSIRSIIRESDYGFRLGGDEFVLILVDVSLNEAADIAHRLQMYFGQLPWPDAVARICRRPTLSIGGVSVRQSQVDSVDDILKRSDDAMYEAKRAGKGKERIIGAAMRPAA